MQFHTQGFRQKDHLPVGNAPKAALDFGDDALANIPTGAGATGREHGLGPTPLETELSHNRPDHILPRWLAHRGWTIRKQNRAFLPISE